MAERKSGPVKPPTIDLTARAAKTEKPASAASSTGSSRKTAESSKPAEAAKPASATSGPSEKTQSRSPNTKKAPRPPALPLGYLFTGLAGAVLGGALGLAGAYGLASAGYWPGSGNSDAVAALRDDMGTLYLKRSEIGDVIDRAANEARPDLSALENRLAALENAAPADSSAELAALDDRIGALEAGLGTLGDKLDAAVMTGGDEAASAALAGIEADMASLKDSVAALESLEAASPEDVAALKDELAAVTDRLGTVAGGVAALENEPEPEPVDLRLPLALSGLSEALETGAPFDTELALVRAALPELAVPAEASSAAGTGLGSAAALEARFLRLVPAILAAKPANADASWTDQAFERLKALVALRPVADEGDATPEGLVSRIETALAARDYAVANAAFNALPAEMQAEAGDIGTAIARFAATADLVTRARAAALALAGSPS